MRLFNAKYQGASIQEGIKITIDLQTGSDVVNVLNAISAEENVISIEKRKFGENWYCVLTTLSPELADEFALQLKAKYALSGSYYDRPVEIRTCP